MFSDRNTRPPIWPSSRSIEYHRMTTAVSGVVPIPPRIHRKPAAVCRHAGVFGGRHIVRDIASYLRPMTRRNARDHASIDRTIAIVRAAPEPADVARETSSPIVIVVLLSTLPGSTFPLLAPTSSDVVFSSKLYWITSYPLSSVTSITLPPPTPPPRWP